MSTSIFHRTTKALAKSTTTVNWLRFACFWGTIILLDFAWGVATIGLTAKVAAFVSSFIMRAGIVFLVAMYEHKTAHVALLEGELDAALASSRDAWAKADRAGYKQQEVDSTHARIAMIDKAIDWVVTTSDRPMTTHVIMGWVNADLAEAGKNIEPTTVAEIELHLDHWADSHDDAMVETDGLWSRVASTGRIRMVGDAIDDVLNVDGDPLSAAMITEWVNVALVNRYADAQPATVDEVEGHLRSWSEKHPGEWMDCKSNLYRRMVHDVVEGRVL